MTQLTKPVTRETLSRDRGKPLIVTLHPTYLELRAKGTRRRYTLTYEACLWQSIKRELDEVRREKAKNKPRSTTRWTR